MAARRGRRWEVLPGNQAAADRLAQDLAGLGVTPLVARCLVAGGHADTASARAFLTPSLERDWEDPLVVPGMAQAADRLTQALDQGQAIAVFGDFDVDGMTATSLLTLSLEQLGADVRPYVPHRFGEGYGLSREALSRMLKDRRPDLVVTVDNGIASRDEVAWLRDQGIDVVVTDHHEPADLVPQEVPVTDPKLVPACPSRELAGAGVALKLVQVLGQRHGMPDLWRGYTDLAALGTISDMMVLQGENRALVADGIARMRESPRPGIQALAAAANVDVARITADQLPFSLVPRLNAAGRMGTTDVALQLLLTQDPGQAQVLAASLEAVNQERRETESALAQEAMAQVDRTYRGGRSIVVGGEGWHEGVKGIVASRVTNRYHVPSILFSIQDGVARGSGRSVGQVNLFAAVERCSDLLTRFGGHAGAVGVTCPAENLPALADRLEEVMQSLPADQFSEAGEVTALATLDEMTVEGIEALEVLQPFGQGNRRPTFMTRGALMRGRGRVGAGGVHLRFQAVDGWGCVPAIMFRVPDVERAEACDEAVDLVYEPRAEEWQGRVGPKLRVEDIIYHDGDGAPMHAPASDLVDDLFSHAGETLARDAYAGVAEERRFVTKLVGVTHEGRQDLVAGLEEGQPLVVAREPDNPADPSAVAVRLTDGRQVGYLRRQIAAALAPLMDVGASYEAHVLQVTGGTPERPSRGANVEVARTDLPEEGQDAREGAATRAGLAQLVPEALTDELRRRMIGNHDLLPAQGEALGRLAQGRSSLCVMATGRGKSLIFHLHAAREAILRGRASVFVFPLRALVADQAFHLGQSLSKLGLSVQVVTGESGQDERDEAFAGLAAGDVDVLLTTPEFLALHTDRFAASGRVGFLVVDEAHHAGERGGRTSYADLPRIRQELGDPTCLAVTATAATPVAREVCRLLGIADEDVLVDPSVRANLSLKDLRGSRDREVAVASCLVRGEKTVVYVNSREQAVAIARSLRHMVPEAAGQVAFYHAGLSREARAGVEEAFRAGELLCVVSTSAFGEGVNLPDVRNVVLYHLPFGAVEFNQMSGRAGRDGRPAAVWLLFGSHDARINERILDSGAPDRAALVTLWRTLRLLTAQARSAGEDSLALTNDAIAEASRGLDPSSRLDGPMVSCGVSVFRELGLLSTSGYGSARRVRLADSPGRVTLEASARYLEGQRAREDFGSFRDWVLSCTAQEALDRINRPICPDFGHLVE